MVQFGTVVNGVIVPEGSPPPEGTQVFFEAAGSFDDPHPMGPYDRERELALLRNRLAEMDAGVPGLSVDEAMALVTAEIEKVADRQEAASCRKP